MKRRIFPLWNLVFKSKLDFCHFSQFASYSSFIFFFFIQTMYGDSDSEQDKEFPEDYVFSLSFE